MNVLFEYKENQVIIPFQDSQILCKVITGSHTEEEIGEVIFSLLQELNCEWSVISLIECGRLGFDLKAVTPAKKEYSFYLRVVEFTKVPNDKGDC